MGRPQPTTIVRPQASRRSDRSKRAKATINSVIPDLLKSSPRARHGVHSSRLITDPPSPDKENVFNNSTSVTGSDLTVRIRHTDALTAARQLTHLSRRASATVPQGQPMTRVKPRNVCILSMASPIRPGGGFLDGATSQEEFLCMRTTLYPSLWDDFYRLPEIGGVLTSDVLVHRDSTADAEDLPKREQFFVDVVSSAMLKFPAASGSKRAEGDEGACSCGVSYCDRDRELVTRKMRAVLRMAQEQGAEKIVLGAWGCGAYGNPVKEVAKIWKKVLIGSMRKKETWSGINEVVFAISDRSMLREFEKCFADVATQEPSLPTPPPEMVKEKTDDAKTPTSDLISELVSKIQETELQLDLVTNPRSKARLRDVIANLNSQLAHVAANEDEDDTLLEDSTEEATEDTDDCAVSGIAASDGEENSYYNFDSEDEASSGSVSPNSSDLYEFRVPDPAESRHPYLQERPGGRRMSTSRFSSYEHVNDVGADQSPRFDHESGWFNGSINGLSALLSKPSKAERSPVLRPQSSDTDVDAIGMGLGEYLRRYSDQEV